MERKIDVMIVGAQKSGTSSLLRYLGEHPACLSHLQKEFSCFFDDKEYEQGFEKALKKFFSHESYTEKTKLICKNANLYAKEEALKRLKEHNPKCEIIFIMRHPTDRTYSSFLMEKNAGSAKFEFSELPELFKKHQEDEINWGFQYFIEYSLYAKYLNKIYEYFPKEQVTLLLYEDLRKDAKSVCKKIFQKIKVDETFIPEVSVVHNLTKKTRSSYYARVLRRLLSNQNPLKKGIKKIISGHAAYHYGEALRKINKVDKKHNSMDENVRAFLVELYKPYNEELAKMIGRDLTFWNK
ncbi:MAG TPA: sulfotransferase [Bacteroidia bacterium]|nr:sulfotransferase [Bacteroidia bacterium]